MSWFIGILIGIISLCTVLGILRGTKEQLSKTLATVLAFGISVGISTILQDQAGDFQLLNSLGSILNPNIIQGVRESLTFLLPSSTAVSTLNNILMLESYSALLMVIIFVIVNKVLGILFTLVFKLGKLEKLIRRDRSRIKASSYILGGVFGLIKGIVIVSVIYSPIIEILAIVI